jgi:hypothetical protein
MDPFDFQWETKQRKRLEALVGEVARLRHLAAASPGKDDLEAEVERLLFENSELKLLLAVVVRILEDKQLTTPTDFIEATEKVAAELRAREPKPTPTPKKS